MRLSDWHRMTSIAATEFDREFESERARWLRRRFVWFCIAMILIDGLFVLQMLGEWLTGGARARLERAGLIMSVPLVLMYFAAAVYGARKSPALNRIVRLSIWLTVLDGVSSLIYFDMERRLNVQFGMPGAVSEWATWVVVSMLLIHLVPCLLVPWTLAESLRPAAALIGLNLFIVGFDVTRGEYGARTAAGVLLLVGLMFVPGAFMCWIRYSRFRQTFLWRFESSKYRRLQSELASARRVHESCLPPLTIEGPVRLSYVYEPMLQIGGDLLFVHPTREEKGEKDEKAAPCERLSAVVVDVTGHGIAAALTVNRLVGELERLFAENPDSSPGEVLRGLNRYVMLTLARHDLYATALCIRVDSAAGEIEWASGGHPPAYLRRADGEVRPLGSTAPLLGVLEPESFDPTAERLPFACGDVVLAYTDGASEACNTKDEQLGTEGVRKLFAEASSDGKQPMEWPSMILRRVSSHRGHDPEDDTLILTIARSEVEAAPEPEREAEKRPPDVGELAVQASRAASVAEQGNWAEARSD
jgi:serine phosphatase RsbU (regulator of sigma subunit)